MQAGDEIRFCRGDVSARERISINSPVQQKELQDDTDLVQLIS